jgi:hypothetical protein
MSLSHITNEVTQLSLPAYSIYPTTVSTNFEMSVVTGTSVAASTTPTATQLVNGVIVFTSATGSGQTLTTPTAPALYTYVTSLGAYPQLVNGNGIGFKFRVVNQSSNSVTLAAGGGITLTVGSTTIAATSSRTFECVFTSSTACTVFG